MYNVLGYCENEIFDYMSDCSWTANNDNGTKNFVFGVSSENYCNGLVYVTPYISDYVNLNNKYSEYPWLNYYYPTYTLLKNLMMNRFKNRNSYIPSVLFNEGIQMTDNENSNIAKVSTEVNYLEALPVKQKDPTVLLDEKHKFNSSKENIYHCETQLHYKGELPKKKRI